MSILMVSLLLAQTGVLPAIDRRTLELQARAETLAVHRPAPRSTHQTRTQTRVATPISTTASRSAPVAPRAARPAAVRNASNGSNLDLSAITTICRAAGNQSDPGAFLATLSRAYSMSADQSGSLRTSCAAYLAGRADARTGRF